MQAGLVEGATGSDAYLVGSQETVQPPYGPSPIDWTVDGVEPPLGVAIDEMEPVGSPSEIAASLPPDEGDQGNE